MSLKIINWLPLAFIITVVCCLLAVVSQQNYRLSANDPQIQLAEDASVALAQTADVTSMVPSYSLDVSKSLATFVIVYDDNGQAVASSAKLNDKTPIIPKGVLDWSKSHGRHQVTWQPQKGTRLAAVVKHFSGTSSGYVLIGRNISHIESRIQMTLIIIAAAWLIALLGSLALTLFLRPATLPKKPVAHSRRS